MRGLSIPIPRISRTSTRALTVAMAGMCVLTFTPATAQQADDPAHTIADKFAGASEPDVEILKKIKIIKQKADEARAKSRAKRASPNHDAAELERAAAIRKAAEKKVAEQQAADEKRRAAKFKEDQLKEQKRKAELAQKAEQKRKADLEHAAEQKRKADLARAAEQEREKQARQDAENKRIAEDARRQKEFEENQALKARQAETSARKAQARAAARRDSQNRLLAAQAAERRRQMEEARQRDWQRAAEKARVEARERARARKDLERRRNNEARSLSERLRRARAGRSGLGATDIDPTQQSSPQGFGVSRPPTSIVSNDHRVAILLIMDVGKKGIRRWSKTADPMVCIKDNCYLSKGTKTHSVRLSRRKAFGPSVALGSRGLACRSKPACIFRGVDLGGPSANLQPVDLRIVRHDRRDARRVEADQNCSIVRGRLVCGKLITADDWRAWVIPESVAEWAGPTVLEAALAKGLR